jgi:hypothetical protein
VKANTAKTRRNIRVVIASPADYVLSERRRVVCEFADDYTAVDHVSHLVSDEMIQRDREELQRAFAVLP